MVAVERHSCSTAGANRAFLMGGFFNLFLRSMTTLVNDPTLGRLNYEGNGYWVGTSPPGEGRISISIHADRRGPASTLLVAAAEVVRRLPWFEARAREYLAISSEDHPWSQLTLGAVESGLPDPQWIRQMRQGSPQSAEAFAGGLPYVALQFRIEGDENVVEAIFAGETPVAWDYH